MFLTDQKEAALNAVLVALQHAADHYAQSVELLENQPASDFFARLLHLRRSAAVQVTEILRSLDFLPTDPDPDRLSLSELATRVKAALVPEVSPILEHKALQLESQIEDQLVSALSIEWPEQVAKTLGRLLNETRTEIKRVQTLERRGSKAG